MTRFPKDCWTKNCEYFEARDMSVDDYCCLCRLIGTECDACDEDICMLLCPLDTREIAGEAAGRFPVRELMQKIG